ncbi:hypothetical protein K3H45_06355 [Aeromonas veronii]|uniref:hypothetical protein n=1 Tax=Aeromonas veronii TaxID=654 RepID=UPI001F336D69|nr:hypothetical protein [Aeromonas veronii]MCF5759516.1 hypothetical protein [Aeromonas veronii]
MAKKKISDEECLSFLRSKWRLVLEQRFKYFLELNDDEVSYTNEILDAALITLEDVYNRYGKLKDPHFNFEIVSGDRGKYEQRLAEMLFYYQLLITGFQEICSNANGPDFFCKKGDYLFCFEVVTPTPSEKLEHLINKKGTLTQEERDFLFRDRLLCVTSAIERKLSDYQRYKCEGIITGEEKYIIVVNDTLLLPHDSPWYGVINHLCYADSTLPIVVDATLGTGEIKFDLDLYTNNKRGDIVSSEYSKVIVPGNISISINNGPAIQASDSVLFFDVSDSIKTRSGKSSVYLKVADIKGVSGYYQITLREDLFMYLVLPLYKSVRPISALISKSSEVEPLKKTISYRYFYSSEVDFVQPDMSPSFMFGLDLDEYNNINFYNMVHSRHLKKERKLVGSR